MLDKGEDLEVCGNCGKKFVKAWNHLYKINGYDKNNKILKGNKNYKKNAYFCCYTCWRKAGGGK